MSSGRLKTKLFATLCVACGLASADTWSGYLVDGRCFDSEENNVNPSDTQLYVDRDRGMEIRACSPRMKAKFFEVVLADGTRVRLDAGGDARARALVRSAGKRSTVRVDITGDLHGNTVQVSSIVLTK